MMFQTHNLQQNRAKEKVDNFKALLEEKGVQGFDTFDNWLLGDT